MVQLLHPYVTTGKITDLTRWTFVSRVMSLLFNKVSSFVMAFLPRSKHHNFMTAVTVFSDFGAQENKKSLTLSIVSASTYHEVMGPDAMIFIF